MLRRRALVITNCNMHFHDTDVLQRRNSTANIFCLPACMRVSHLLCIVCCNIIPVKGYCWAEACRPPRMPQWRSFPLSLFTGLAQIPLLQWVCGASYHLCALLHVASSQHSTTGKRVSAASCYGLLERSDSAHSQTSNAIGHSLRQRSPSER